MMVTRIKKVATRAGVTVRKTATKVAATVAAAAAVVISAVSVREIVTLRAKRDALTKELADVAKLLVEREAAVITALRSGVLPGPGCPPIAATEEKVPVRPKWKDEALVLAEKLGLNKAVYEAEVKARVEAEMPPEKRTTWKLVINGDGK